MPRHFSSPECINHWTRPPQVPISSFLFAYFDIPLEARCPIALRPPHQTSADDANPNRLYHMVRPQLLQVTVPQASSPDTRLGKRTQPNKGTVRRGNAPFAPNVSREAIICDPTRELTAASDHLNAESATRLLPANTIVGGTNCYTMRKTESSVVAFPDPTGNWAAGAYPTHLGCRYRVAFVYGHHRRRHTVPCAPRS